MSTGTGKIGKDELQWSRENKECSGGRRVLGTGYWLENPLRQKALTELWPAPS